MISVVTNALHVVHLPPLSFHGHDNLAHFLEPADEQPVSGHVLNLAMLALFALFAHPSLSLDEREQPGLLRKSDHGVLDLLTLVEQTPPTEAVQAQPRARERDDQPPHIADVPDTLRPDKAQEDEIILLSLEFVDGRYGRGHAEQRMVGALGPEHVVQ